MLPVLALLIAMPAHAQFDLDHTEFGGGYVYVSKDAGLNGGNLNTALQFNSRIALGFDYDTVWNNSVLGVLSATSIGLTRVRTHQQNFLIGPRIFFPAHKLTKYHFDPFAEVQVGGTHENQQVQTAALGTVSASGNSYSWLVGGGADYRFTGHWSARMKMDFFRTHIAASGQSRFRLALGVAYTIRDKKTANF